MSETFERIDGDNRGHAIIATGGLLGGFTFYGPFVSIDAALKWYELSLLGRCEVPVTVALLENPDKTAQVSELEAVA